MMYKTCKALEHFFEDVKLGDVIAAYKNIVAVYNRKTTAGFVAASKAFTNSDMSIDHVDLCEFIALVAAEPSAYAPSAERPPSPRKSRCY